MAVVIRTPEVYGPIEAPGNEFISMVGNIRCHIGRNTVISDENLILFKSQLFAGKPDGAFLFNGIAFPGQIGDGLIHLSAFVEGFFGKPHIVPDTVGCQYLPDTSQVYRQGVVHKSFSSLL